MPLAGRELELPSSNGCLESLMTVDEFSECIQSLAVMLASQSTGTSRHSIAVRGDQFPKQTPNCINATAQIASDVSAYILETLTAGQSCETEATSRCGACRGQISDVATGRHRQPERGHVVLLRDNEAIQHHRDGDTLHSADSKPVHFYARPWRDSAHGQLCSRRG